MYEVTVAIPPAFLAPLDELVAQSGSGTREAWVRNVIRAMLADYQMKKDLNPEVLRRMQYLMSLWP